MRGEEIVYVTEDHEVPTFVNIERYPDGSPMVKHWPEWQPTRILLRPRDSAGFLGGIFWIQALLERGDGPNPELIFPCLFGQRQDRTNLTGDTLFTAKSVGKLINSLELPRVTVLDPHSDVSHAVIDRCRVIHVDDIWAHHLGNDPADYDAVMAPDAGAVKRAARIAKHLELPLLLADKTRDVSNGKITGFKIYDDSVLFPEHPHDHDRAPKVLVVDDLCDGGGTFIGLGELLQAKGIDADLYVTHGLFTKGTADLKKIYDNIICTDSVAAVRPETTILFTSETILKAGDLP